MSISMRSSKAQMYSEIEMLRARCDRLEQAARPAPAAPAAEHAACKRCDGSGTYGEHGECFRCDGTGKDPGVVAGRTQFRARRRAAADGQRRRQAAAQPARSNSGAPRSGMADAARRYCAEHGVASCTVEQARSML